MSDGSELPAETCAHDGVIDAARAKNRPGGLRLQVGLRTIALLLAAIAVWTAVYINRRKNAELTTRIAAAIPLAHELVVDDPKQVAVVMMEQEWFDDSRWEVYLPAGDYRLCLATREIDQHGLAPVVRSLPLAAGRHRIGVEQKEDKSAWHVSVSLNGRPVLDQAEPKEWFTSGGSSGSGEFSLNTQLDPAKPVVLFRRRFLKPIGTTNSSTTPSVPSEGVLLWIERVRVSASR